MTVAQAAGLRAALRVGYHLLDRGGSALTAVEQAIRVLEGLCQVDPEFRPAE